MKFEPDGGNLYLPHVLQIHSGKFWRCKHGNTGFKEGFEWVGCQECAQDNPKAFNDWHGSRTVVKQEAQPEETAEWICLDCGYKQLTCLHCGYKHKRQ